MASVRSAFRAGINYRFCAVCGSSIYFDMIFPTTGQRFFTIALGCFVDAVFPPPTDEFFTKFRHPWVPPIPDAVSSMTHWERTPNRRGVTQTRGASRPTHNPSALASTTGWGQSVSWRFADGGR